MSTILKILVLAPAIVISFFVVWRRLREDYQDNEIFPLSIGIMGGVFVGSVGASFITPYVGDVRFWGGVIGGIGSGVWLTKKISIRFFEALEAVVPAVFLYLLFQGIISVSSPITIVKFADPLLAIVSLLAFVYVSKKYRRFMWLYPSGKIGLGALLSSLAFFTGTIMIAILRPGMLSWQGLAFGTLGALATFGIIYVRSGREIRLPFRIGKRRVNPINK